MYTFNYSDPNSGTYWMPGFYVIPGYMALPNEPVVQAPAAESAMLPLVELQNPDAVELPDQSALSSCSLNPSVHETPTPTATSERSSGLSGIKAKKIIASDWTPEEVEFLKKSLLGKSPQSIKKVANHLGRSEQACRNRLNHIIFTTQLRDLVDPMRVMPERTFKQLTGKALNDEEKSILADRLKKGATLPVIALELHKTLRACKNAMKSLQLTIKKARSNPEPIDSEYRADSVHSIERKKMEYYMESRRGTRAQLENEYLNVTGNSNIGDGNQQTVDFFLPGHHQPGLFLE